MSWGVDGFFTSNKVNHKDILSFSLSLSRPPQSLVRVTLKSLVSFFPSIFLHDQWSSTYQPPLSHNLDNIAHDTSQWCLSVILNSP